MIEKILKYKCPSCGSRRFKAPAGFLGLATVCSDSCKVGIKIKAENQFRIWGFSDKELNNLYWRVMRLLTTLDQDPAKFTYVDFMVWLYTKHGYSKIELARVYSSLAEVANARVER